MTDLAMTDLVEQYKKLNQDVQKLEGALETTRAKRGLVAGQLLARDGKGVGYDMGDGVERIVCMTKVGTHYLVARNKWVKRPGVPKAPRGPKAPKAAKAPKPKRAIVNGQIVDVSPGPAPRRKAARLTAQTPVPVEPAPASEPKLTATEPVVPQAVAPERVAEPEAVETSVAPEAQAPVAEAELPKAAASPAVAPPVAPPAAPEPEVDPEIELDPLDAALAALDLL
jgi:hypothetical protein